jgi:thioesterase domain-containing protein
MQRVLMKVRVKYQPKPYTGRVVLFQIAQPSTHRMTDPILWRRLPLNGWGGLIQGEVEVVSVPGRHQEIFNEPFVQTVAAKTAEVLRRK